MKKTVKKNINQHNKTKKSRSGCKVIDNSFEEEYEQSEIFKNKNIIGINKELNELFKKYKTPKGITPQNDYFTYINYLWIKQQHDDIKKNEKKYYVQIDNFRMVQEKVYHDIIDIAKESKNKDIINVHNSIIKLDQKSIEANIEKEIGMINKFIEKDELMGLLAYINSNEIVSWGCPVFWKMIADEQNPSKFISHITSPVMAMYEYELLVEGAKTSDAAEKYRKFYKKKRLENIKTLFDFCLGKDNNLNPQHIWDVEFDIFSLFMCDDIKNDSVDFYNVLDAKKSMEICGFNWVEFSKALGFKTPPKTFISSSLNYLKCVTKLLQDNWKTDKWRTYWYYIYLRPMSRFGDKFEKILYGFAGKFVQGQDVIFPRELSPVFALSMCFNSYLTEQYNKKFRKEEVIDYVQNMADDLRRVFVRILKRNTWLSPKTKEIAIHKLEHLNLIIGNATVEYDDPKLNYSETDAWGNMVKIMKWRCEKFISLEGKNVIDIPYIDWREMPFKLTGKQSYIVNAYYTPIENSIFIPLAYLQKPFIDLDERGIEYNLAHIGFTIGHELSHSLDNIGSKYDYTGKLYDWWLPKDKEHYEYKLQDIIKQYEVFTGYDNIKFDVHMSLSEDLADISGLAICVEYLRDFQDKNDDVAYIRKLSFAAFFCYYAIQARQAISKKAIAAQLKNNPHPLDKYRVNCTLARLNLFKSIYEVKKGDKMFWDTRDTFWGHD